MSHQFPAADVASVFSAGELGDAQNPSLIAHRCLRPSSSQGRSRRKELGKPLFVLWVLFLVNMLFKLQTRRLQFAQGGQPRRGKLGVAVNERLAG